VSVVVIEFCRSMSLARKAFVVAVPAVALLLCQRCCSLQRTTLLHQRPDSSDVLRAPQGGSV